MSKLLYTRFTKLIIDYLLSLNKSIPRKSNSKLHNSQDDHPITKLLNTTNGDYKFGMEVIDAMISDAIKKKSGWKRKGFMYYGDQVANDPNKLKKDVVPRRTRSLTIAEESVVGEHAKSISIQEPRSQRRRRSQLTIDSQTDEAVSDMYNEWGQKLKGPAVEDPVVQSLLDLRDATLYSSSLDESEESANETDDADESDMDLIHMEMMMLQDFIQTLLDETPANELTDFMSHPVYTDAHTTSVVHNPKGNPELTSYISDKNAHHIPSPPAKKTPYHTTTPESSSLQAKAKKLMQKAKKNIRKFNFIKAVTQKFREYDQKLEALTNFNISEAFEKAVQAKVLTEIKKLLPTHIPNAIANYVKPCLNTSVLEVMKTNQINLFTQSSTSTYDLSKMDLKLKLLNRIHLNKSNDTHTTHQQLCDTLYESIILDQNALNAQAVQSSFHKRSHDNQDPPNNLKDDTPAMKPLDKSDTLIQKYSNPEWFPKKSGLAKRKMTWFDLFLKSDIDKDENHIPGPSTVAIAKKFKELIQKDEFTIADLEGAGLEWLKMQYNNDVELEYHISQLKAAVLSEAQWNSDE
ncbi:hypothetical protein Tco_1459972 [Tanacetum coccineum]